MPAASSWGLSYRLVGSQELVLALGLAGSLTMMPSRQDSSSTSDVVAAWLWRIPRERKEVEGERFCERGRELTLYSLYRPY